MSSQVLIHQSDDVVHVTLSFHCEVYVNDEESEAFRACLLPTN